jgi:hypothetical protein
MKSIIRIGAAVSVFLAPVLARAAFEVSGGITPSGGFLGFSVGSGKTSGMFGFGGGAACNFTICGIGATILYIINSILVPVLFAVAFIVFLYGVAEAYIFSRGSDTARANGHKHVLWGIVGFAVMLSLWGLVNIVASTFGLAGVTAPPTPTSY